MKFLDLTIKFMFLIHKKEICNKGIAARLFRTLMAFACFTGFDSADAKTITVSSDQDPAAFTPGTLRYEINNALKGDVIQFAPQVSSITLSQGQIIINQDLSFYGQGVIINGNGATRLFKIEPERTCVFDGFVFTNGFQFDGQGGGAIYNEGDLTLKNCVFSKNKSVAGNGMGGAILNFRGTLALDSCILTSNSCEVLGGALFLNLGKAKIKNSSFVSNQSNDRAGAIENRCAELIIEKTNFSNNSAEKDDGGAIVNNAGNIKLSSVSFTNNYAAKSGGAIWNYCFSSLNIKKCTFAENSCRVLGGAIFNQKDGEMTIDTSTIALNSPDNVFEE